MVVTKSTKIVTPTEVHIQIVEDEKERHDLMNSYWKLQVRLIRNGKVTPDEQKILQQVKNDPGKYEGKVKELAALRTYDDNAAFILKVDELLRPYRP